MSDLDKPSKRPSMRKGRKNWKPHEIERFIALYPITRSNAELAEMFEVSRQSINAMARKFALVKAPQVSKFWTECQRAYVAARYATESAREIGAVLGKSESAVHDMAGKLGLKKSREWIVERARQNALKPDAKIRKTWFPKNNIPWNAGMTGLCLSPATQFKKGNLTGRAAQIAVPIGSDRINYDGYLQRKCAATGYSPHDWKFVHHLVWRMHDRTIPRNHVVIFRDGDKTNLDINNLELISRAELMRRNSWVNHPTEIRLAMQMKGVLARAINAITRKESDEAHQ